MTGTFVGVESAMIHWKFQRQSHGGTFYHLQGVFQPNFQIFGLS